MTIADICTHAGYYVYDSGITYAEIDTLGHWHMVVHQARRVLDHSDRDHYSIIIRADDGTRTLHDIGTGGEVISELPSLACKPAKDAGGYIGVYFFKGWHARVSRERMKAPVYLGTFATAQLAALARDRYVIEHGMTQHTQLNFPELLNDLTKQREQEVEAA